MDAILTLFPFLLLAAVLVLANLEGQSPAFRLLTYISLGLLNLLMIMAGLIGILLPSMEMVGVPTDVAEAYGVLLRAMGLTGLLGFLPLVRPVRVLVSRFIPISADSAVHMTALVFAIYLVGQGLGQQPLLSDPEVVGGLGLQVTSGAVWAQGVGLAILAIAGVGFVARRDWRATLDRLGLKSLTLGHLAWALGGIVTLILLQVGVALLWQALDPEGFRQIEEANNLLLGQFEGLAAAFTIGLAAALGEELVFRGALQPRFGLALTAVLFTLIHSQYGLSPATLLILLIAIVLGVLRNRTSLTVCILVHFGYNFVSVLLPSLGQ